MDVKLTLELHILVAGVEKAFVSIAVYPNIITVQSRFLENGAIMYKMLKS